MQSALTAIARVREGQATVHNAVTACLDRIAADTSGNAVWVSVDRELALVEARDIDMRLASGEDLPLAGLCLGVKDIFAVKGLALRAGSGLRGSEASQADAALVARLRQAGAVIVGTTSMPNYALGITPGAYNPFDARHTPGSSSTGCALAVALGHVPATLAMQTNASIIRPASFCGVVAFKPSQGCLSLDGALPLVPSLDQPGFMAASAADIVPLHAALTGEHPAQCPAPRYAFMRTPMWEQADASTRKALEALAANYNATEISFPGELNAAWDWLNDIMDYELARHLPHTFATDERVGLPLRQALARGRDIADQRYAACLHGKARTAAWGQEQLALYDAVITPAAAGPAPLLEQGAGSPVFSTFWNLMGAPCLSMPLSMENGLPVGVQLTGAPGKDAPLLAAALHMERRLRAA